LPLPGFGLGVAHRSESLLIVRLSGTDAALVTLHHRRYLIHLWKGLGCVQACKQLALLDVAAHVVRHPDDRAGDAWIDILLDEADGLTGVAHGWVESF